MTRITEDTQPLDPIARLREIASKGPATDLVSVGRGELRALVAEHRCLEASQLAGAVGERDALREALVAADKRLCELTPTFPPDVGPDLRDAGEIEKTGAVVMQIRAALSPNQGAKL